MNLLYTGARKAESLNSRESFMQENTKWKSKRRMKKPYGEDCMRILVGRLWPLGLTKEKATVELWLKELAPALNFGNGLAVTL